MFFLTLPRFFALAAVCLITAPLYAEEPPEAAETGNQKAAQWVRDLKFETGEVTVGNGVAQVKLADGFRYLNPKDSEKYLTLLGNPPSKVLGILFPKEGDLLASGGWFVVLDYEQEGHVKDDDAAKIDYSDLLKTMQEQSTEINKEREKQGYQAVNLVGWATPPHYDASTHKLYWAKELAFQGEPSHTLNYNIRMLGRQGVLVANAVGGMEELQSIEAATPTVLSMIDFTPGNRYADFNPKTDHTAEYGIAGLIAGAAGMKLAAKAGIFALLAKKAAVLWKFILIGVLAVVGVFKKIFRRGQAV